MKLLFTDLDGTLLNNQAVISEYTISILKKMIQSGHALILSSGRPLNSILEVKDQANLGDKSIFVIAYNGALIYDCERKENILEHRLLLRDVDLIFRMADEMNLHVHTYTDTSILSVKEDREVKQYREKIHLPLILNDHPSSILKQGPFKVLAVDLDDKTKLEAFSEKISLVSNKRLTCVFSNDHYLEIFSSDSSKGNALTYLSKCLHIPIENTYASGDAANDLSMLQACGHAIAMKNGDTSLFAYADITTEKTNDEDGLAQVIQRYLID